MTRLEIGLFKQSFYFLRHGESASNVAHTIAGVSDVPLTERGRAQAHAAALMLRNRGIAAIYSSALTRAEDTAKEISNVLNLHVVVIPELAERNWGELQGKSRAMRAPGLIPPGAETTDQFRTRILRGLARVDPDDISLIVSHAGVFRMLCALLGVSLREDAVANAEPMLFLSPSERSSSWRIESGARHRAAPNLASDEG